MFRPRSLRVRIALAYIVGSLLVAGVVALGTFLITSSVLRGQAVENAKNESFDSLVYLRDQLQDEEGPGNLRIYLRTLQQRGQDVVVITPAINPLADSTSIGLTLDAIPRGLRSAVQKEQVAYAFFGGPGHRSIAFGSYVPESNPRIYAFFAYSLEGVDRTLSLLWRVLLGVVALAATVAGAVGLRLANRTIRPLRVAADAARQIAAGQYDTRLQQAGEDELARLAGAFNQMTHALEEQLARERRFVADASHELRTPLTALKTSIDFVAERAEELPARLRSAVGLAADEVKSLQRLISDLLELMRAEAGALPVSMQDVDLVDFAREIVRRRAPDAQVTIDGPEELVVCTDKSRLERIVGNLVENAVTHGGRDGARIVLEDANGEAHLLVMDSGPGMAEENLPRIFERFWRGDASRQRDGRVGSGLGLAIARENAVLIGADLQVASVPGVGTTFEVTIPRGDRE